MLDLDDRAVDQVALVELGQRAVDHRIHLLVGDVLEVDDTALVLRILIHVEEARHVGRVQPGGHVTPQASHTRRVVRGVDHRHLRPFDLGRDIAYVRAVDRDPQASG